MSRQTAIYLARKTLGRKALRWGAGRPAKSPGLGADLSLELLMSPCSSTQSSIHLLSDFLAWDARLTLPRCPFLWPLYCYNVSHIKILSKVHCLEDPATTLMRYCRMQAPRKQEIVLDHNIPRLPVIQDSDGKLVGQVEDQDLSGIDCHPDLENLPTVGHDWEDEISCVISLASEVLPASISLPSAMALPPSSPTSLEATSRTTTALLPNPVQSCAGNIRSILRPKHQHN